MASLFRRRPPLIIANPTESDSEDSASDGPPAFSPATLFSAIDPPAPLAPDPRAPHVANAVPDDVSASSRSSPAPDTTPPRTPGQPLPPVSLAADGLDPQLPPKDRPYHHHSPHHPDRDPDSHGIGRAPLHARRPSIEPAHSQSPILSISKAYSPLSPADCPAPRIIMATADSDMYIKVNITAADSGEVIRELIFSALQVADEDQLGFSVFQTELGESALGDPLSNDQLLDMCSRSADRKGTLKFIIQRSSAQVYVRPDIRALPIPPPPTTIPPLPKAPPPQLAVVPNGYRPGTRNGARASPQSQHDTSSSTSDRRTDSGPGYDASVDDYEGHRRAGIIRTMHSYQQLPRPAPPMPPPQPPPRPSVGISVGIHRIPKGTHGMRGASPSEHGPSRARRGASPIRSSPGGTFDGASSLLTNLSHQLPPVPSVAPLQIDRRRSVTPTPPIPGGYHASRSPPHSRDGLVGAEAWHSPHGRKTSETAAERERMLEQTEAHRERALSQSQRDEDRRREREKTQLMRSEQTQQWREQQMRSDDARRRRQQTLLERNGGDSSSNSQSPSDTLSPGTSWFGPERGSRPVTRGGYRDLTADRDRPSTAQPTSSVGARGAYHDAAAERDRPSTAQPILSPQTATWNGRDPYPTMRTPPAVLIPGGGRPTTGSSTGSGASGRGGPMDTPRALQPSYRGQQAAASGASSTMLQQLDARTLSPDDRGQAVPRNWMVGWRAHDGRTATTLQQRRLPLTAGSKSMDNLRNQYFNGAPAGGKGLKLQTGPQRRLPTPSSSAQRAAPNNYGGPSEYGTAVSPQFSPPTAPLPYYDQHIGRSGLSSSFSASARSPAAASPGTATSAADYAPLRGGTAQWRDERPRSPQRGSPKIGAFRHEDLREPRPPYGAPPPRTTENIVRGEHAGSFGQAAQNLSPGLGAARTSSDTAPMLPSPLEGPEHAVESTLQPADHQWILKMLDGDLGELPAHAGNEEATVMPARKHATSHAAASPSTSFTGASSTLLPDEDEDEDADEYEDEDDEYSEGEDEAGKYWQGPAKKYWQDTKKRRVSKAPSLRPIQTGILPPVPHAPPPQPPYHKAPRSTLSPTTNVNRHSSFTKRDSVTWAFRPPPEDMYERLEEFFPDHDLDKPVIDATPSGGSSPTQAEHAPQAVFPPQTRARHKKSIRVVVSDRKSKLGSPTAQNMLRKRSTKLWGSRVEEVTPAQARAGALSAAPDSPPGAANPKRETIFKWVKGDLIGKGTYGRVYLALNATTCEMIAVKQVELPRTVSDQEDIRQLQVLEALKSESDTLKDLDHPNVVQYLGLEESTEFLSIFLEYVPGGSIGGCLRKHGKFDHDVVRSFTSQVLAGLEYLHSRGVLHRDLKADNILLDPSGICKITDFGISKRSADIYDNDTALTNMQGSIFWMAPEVLHNNKQGYNAKIDIWSLGCVVLEMWAGRRPWNQEEVFAVMFKLGASREAPPVPDDVELDAVEDDFRRQCFAVNPNERPTAAELRKHTFLELKPGWEFTGFT